MGFFGTTSLPDGSPGAILQNGTTSPTATIDWNSQDLSNVGTLTVSDGVEASPSVAFQTQTTTGFWRPGSGQIAFSMAGVERARFTPAALIMKNGAIIENSAGAEATPSYSFDADMDLGLYRVSEDVLGVSAGGSLQFSTTTSGIDLAPNKHIVFNTSTADTFTLRGSSDDPGIYLTSDLPAYHNVSIAGGGDNTKDVYWSIYGRGGNFDTASLFENVNFAYDSFGPEPRYMLYTGSGNGGTTRPLILSYNYGSENIILDDASSVKLGVENLTRPEDSTADANPAANLTIQSANKTAGTGNGGNLNLFSGTSVGGSKGDVNLDGNTINFTAVNAIDFTSTPLVNFTAIDATGNITGNTIIADISIDSPLYNRPAVSGLATGNTLTVRAGDTEDGTGGTLLLEAGSATGAGVRGTIESRAQQFEFNIQRLPGTSADDGIARFRRISSINYVELENTAIKHEVNSVTITADNQALSSGDVSGRFLIIDSDDPIASNRTFTLSNFTGEEGHIITFIFTSATNAVEFLNSGNLSADWVPSKGYTLTLAKVDNSWYEISRSNNA